MENTALYNLKELHRYRDASPDSPAVLVGLAWYARTSKDDEKALELLKRAKDGNPRFAEARVALANLLWDLGRFGELRILLGESRSREINDVRFWVVRGKLAERDGQKNAAVRCFWEALRRDQTNRVATYKLHLFFVESKNHEQSEAFRRRIEALQTLRERSDQVASKENTSQRTLRQFVEQLEHVGRLWEAWGWCAVALETDPHAEWAVKRADSLRLLLKTSPLTLCCRPFLPSNFDLSTFPLPKWESKLASPQQLPSPVQSQVSFRDDAKSAGLVFEYFNSPSAPGKGQRMYEFNGGGCAVLDYDSDGWPDLYFTQGCRWPVKDGSSEHVDRLFRNLGNGRFADVTREAGLSENRFSTGVAVGDFDNDGFPDLYIANIGRNRLFRNNGDGTFEDVTDAAGVADPRWSTSCVIVDLNGDSLPDIYSVNYLQGPTIFETVCKHQDGQPRICLPFHFSAAQDQLFLNLGDGRFENVTAKSGIRVSNGKGLGVVAADWQGKGRIGLFVANDTVPNSFFQNRGPQPDGTPSFQERGLSAGIALNRDGRAEGCMGIAVGDADGDGDLDLFVTNFYRETNTLYRSLRGLTFNDVTREAGLAEPSRALLGFGTQFLDADLDGRLDLLVTNGHIDDYRRYGRPYEMPAQFFWNRGGGRFAVQPAQRVGPYFARKLLGRSLARLDWNRDGKEDAVISHLNQPVALLTNTTKRCGRYLSIRLRGVRSSRDAIGTTVVVHTENRKITRQLTAGDGYQASNQRLLVFGLANAKTVERVDVIWPSGMKESF
ncbi:MAG: VCBS repeat-containing protein, partial [Planctomycetes bacterium]|nr:VCBS repeat-containing protein [Planctomycetota bacterium]